MTHTGSSRTASRLTSSSNSTRRWRFSTSNCLIQPLLRDLLLSSSEVGLQSERVRGWSDHPLYLFSPALSVWPATDPGYNYEQSAGPRPASQLFTKLELLISTWLHLAGSTLRYNILKRTCSTLATDWYRMYWIGVKFLTPILAHHNYISCAPSKSQL